MSGETDPLKTDADPIDAEFETEAPVADFVAAPEPPKKGPGWMALGATGVMAALFGAGAGTMLSDRGQSDYAPDTLIEDVQIIAEGQVKQEDRLLEMISELDTRLRGEISSVIANATEGEGGNAVAADLTLQIQALTAQLDALEANVYEAADTEGTDTDQLLARLEALETLEEGEVASPRLANRAIQSVQRRIDELEGDLAGRSDAMINLVSRLEALEANVPGEAGAVGEIAPDVLESLRADIEALKTGASEQGSSVQPAEIEELRTLLQDLREGDIANREALSQRGAGQTAAFSILSIEAAARNGRPFQAAFAKLEAALPGNRSVAKLKPLASTGAPTIASLQRGFETARANAATLAAETETGSSSDGWSWVRQALGEAVVVRRSGEEGEVSADTSAFEAAMSIAELRLAVRDVEGAIGAVKTLDDVVRAPFEDWLGEAQSRQLLEDGLDELRLTLMDTGR